MSILSYSYRKYKIFFKKVKPFLIQSGLFFIYSSAAKPLAASANKIFM